MSLDPVKNFGKVEVSTGYASGATTIVLSTGEGAKLPQPSTDGAFNLVWWNYTDYPDPSDDPNVEIVRVTVRSSDTLTITRAQESTSDNNHNTGGKTYKMILSMTKKMIDDIQIPAGSDRELIFNNSNVFGATSNAFWDKTNERLSIGSTVVGKSARFSVQGGYTLGEEEIEHGTFDIQYGEEEIDHGIFDTQ
jgi:hypothetical protein